MKMTWFSTCLLVLILASGMEAKGENNRRPAKIKAQVAKAGKPKGFAMLDQDGNLPRDFLPDGYDQYSAYDLGWQSLHMAAAGACRGSTPTGGTGCCGNVVMVRNSADKRSCTELCARTAYKNCDAGVSIYGRQRKATRNGEIVGSFYNYACHHREHGGSEAYSRKQDIMDSRGYYSFCCCRK